MPYFTLHRDYVLRTTYGHSIGFKKGEKTWVPPVCVNDVVAIGGISDEPVDVIPSEESAPAILPAEDRKAAILAAFDTMRERNERTDFTATGLPNMFKLEKLCGFEVHSRERDELWVEYTANRVPS